MFVHFLLRVEEGVTLLAGAEESGLVVPRHELLEPDFFHFRTDLTRLKQKLVTHLNRKILQNEFVQLTVMPDIVVRNFLRNFS